MIVRLLLALYPRAWRQEYGAEYVDLLHATRLTHRVLLDVVREALRLRAAARPLLVSVLAALVLSALVETAGVRSGLTDNILWLPTDLARGLALAAVLAPWALVAAGVRSRRHDQAGRLSAGKS